MKQHAARLLAQPPQLRDHYACVAGDLIGGRLLNQLRVA
jgi:hypothetical protein